MIIRDEKGRIQKGSNPNPKGRPKGPRAIFSTEDEDKAIETVREMSQSATNERIRLDAAIYIIDRNNGRIPQKINLDDARKDPRHMSLEELLSTAQDIKELAATLPLN
jgi:hypothetical protein